MDKDEFMIRKPGNILKYHRNLKLAKFDIFFW